MRPYLKAAGGAAAVAACVAGLLTLGPVDAGDDRAAPPAGGARSQAPAAAPAEAAVAAARAETERFPDEPSVWAQLAHAEIESARTTLDASRLDAAERALNHSLDLDHSDNHAAVTGMGLLANARHEFARGRAHGLRSTRMAPDRPDGYAVLADAEIQLGHYRAARRAVQRLLDLDPDSAAWARAAYDLQTHGRTEDAAIALRRAAQSADTPDQTAFAEHRLGELAFATGEPGRAERHFRRALSAAPGHAHARAGLARVAAARGRTDAALATYDRLVTRTPLPQFLLESVELRLSAGRSKAGETREQLAALDAQVRLLRAAGGPVDVHLALYEADHGDPRVAVRLMRRAWRESRSVVVADALGWALHRAGRSGEALAYARKAAATGWDNALFHYHRGVIEHARGLPDARRHLREALERNPHFSPYHAPRAAAVLDEHEERRR